MYYNWTILVKHVELLSEQICRTQVYFNGYLQLLLSRKATIIINSKFFAVSDWLQSPANSLKPTSADQI